MSVAPAGCMTWETWDKLLFDWDRGFEPPSSYPRDPVLLQAFADWLEEQGHEVEHATQAARWCASLGYCVRKDGGFYNWWANGQENLENENAELRPNRLPLKVFNHLGEKWDNTVLSSYERLYKALKELGEL